MLCTVIVITANVWSNIGNQTNYLQSSIGQQNLLVINLRSN